MRSAQIKKTSGSTQPVNRTGGASNQVGMPIAAMALTFRQSELDLQPKSYRRDKENRERRRAMATSRSLVAVELG